MTISFMGAPCRIPQGAGAEHAIQEASVMQVLGLSYCSLPKDSSKHVFFADVCEETCHDQTQEHD